MKFTCLFSNFIYYHADEWSKFKVGKEISLIILSSSITVSNDMAISKTNNNIPKNINARAIYVNTSDATVSIDNEIIGTTREESTEVNKHKILNFTICACLLILFN